MNLHGKTWFLVLNSPHFPYLKQFFRHVRTKNGYKNITLQNLNLYQTQKPQTYGLSWAVSVQLFV